jgi:cytochrome c-type biogenesis protein CcmH
MKRGVFLALAFLAAPLGAQGTGVDAPYANRQLSEPAQEARAMALMEDLRCIQCQGQSIADSDAPIAAAMRSEVRERIQKGETPETIRSWMISRYGDWVSFDPPLNLLTIMLWFAPLVFLAAGFWLSRGLFKGNKS